MVQRSIAGYIRITLFFLYKTENFGFFAFVFAKTKILNFLKRSDLKNVRANKIDTFICTPSKLAEQLNGDERVF